MDCTIVRLEAGSSVQLMGLVLSGLPRRIHYVLTICFGAGETAISEIGDLDICADVPTEFGLVRLPTEAGRPVDAHLLVTTEGTRIECQLMPANDATLPN